MAPIAAVLIQLGFGTLTHTIINSGAVPPAVPPAPNGLTAASPTCGQINLSWNASSGATNYDVMRSTSTGGPYTNLLSLNVTSTNYIDTSVLNGVSYHYVVSACNAGGESPQSTEAGITSASLGSLPSGWLHQAHWNHRDASAAPAIATTSFPCKALAATLAAMLIRFNTPSKA